MAVGARLAVTLRARTALRPSHLEAAVEAGSGSCPMGPRARYESAAPSQLLAAARFAGRSAHRYADEWTVSITDITALAHEIHRHVRDGDPEVAQQVLPQEPPYPVPDGLLDHLRPMSTVTIETSGSFTPICRRVRWSTTSRPRRSRRLPPTREPSYGYRSIGTRASPKPCVSWTGRGRSHDGGVDHVQVGQVQRADPRGLVGGHAELAQQSTDDQVRGLRIVTVGLRVQ